MDYRIEEVLTVMRKLRESAETMPRAKLAPAAVQHGLSLSRTVCQQPEFVFATPWMKNLLVSCGDVQAARFEEDGQPEVISKLRAGERSKAVDLVNAWVKAALLKFNGKERDSYDESLPIGSIEHLNTDCWLGWRPQIWDVQPGQAAERAGVFRQYTDPNTNYSYEQMVQAIRKEPHLRNAILLALETLPEVQASREVSEISDPFISKGTGVSYPDYRNDRTTVATGKAKGMTYGQYEIELTKRAASQGMDALRSFAYANNVYTGYPRNQRGKGRALEAQSRRTNLVVNLVNSPEQKLWKDSPVLGTAFQDEERIKAALIEKAEFIESHPDYVGRNEDTSGWDRSVGVGWITLSNSLRYLRAKDSYTRDLVEIRHNCACGGWLVDGPNNRVAWMYGRTPSGYGDTTLQNSTVHRILSNSALLTIDPHYYEQVVVPTDYKYTDIVGDDILAIFPKGAEKVRMFREYYKKKGFTIHSDEKSIFGAMFIQYRLCRDPSSQKWVMTYNWPRVLRSMLSKETAKQLGVGGWTLSAYQQLGKLIEYPDYCQIPLNLICACDQFKLHLDTPINQIKQMVKDEDRRRAGGTAKEGSAQSVRILTTAERIANNPTIRGAIEKNGRTEIDWDYFGAIQEKLRSMYNPNFLKSLGFKNPDLSKIR